MKKTYVVWKKKTGTRCVYQVVCTFTDPEQIAEYMPTIKVMAALVSSGLVDKVEWSTSSEDTYKICEQGKT